MAKMTLVDKMAKNPVKSGLMCLFITLVIIFAYIWMAVIKGIILSIPLQLLMAVFICMPIFFILLAAIKIKKKSRRCSDGKTSNT
jgi:amino acid permease